MLDFNSQGTVTTPPGDIVKIVILERREQVIEAIEECSLQESSGVNTKHKRDIVRARLISLFFELGAILKRKDVERFDEYKVSLLDKNTKLEDLKEIMFDLNSFIDEIGLTKIDSREAYDRTNIEYSNKMQGYR